MKKVKKITSKNIKNIVKEHFLEDTNLPEHKIDAIIKEYLTERDEFLEDENPFGDEYEFSPKTKDAISDMTEGIMEMVDDLEVIKEKEGNVLIFNDVYADEYLNGVISDLNGILDDLKFLTELKDNREEDLDL